jgi:hypothetical protein
MREKIANPVITKETYKGKEVVVLDDDVRSATKSEAPYIRKGQFRLMDLPAELRVYIYQFLLPHNMVVKFKEKDNPSYHAQYEASRVQAYAKYQPEWDVIVTSKHEEKVAEAASLVAQNSADIRVHGRGLGMRVFRRRLPPKPIPNLIQTQMFLISKAVSLEARGKPSSPNTPFPHDTNLSQSCCLRLKHLHLQSRLQRPPPHLHEIPPHLWPLRRRRPLATPPQSSQHSHQHQPQRPLALERKATTRTPRILRQHPETAFRRYTQEVVTPRVKSHIR